MNNKVETRGTVAASFAWSGVALALLLAGIGLSCRSTSAPEGNQGVSLVVDAVPLLLKADSVSVSTIWATVLEDGAPVPDSTLVSFATSLGSVEPEAYTRDGLAKARFSAGDETGVAAVVAQARAVRDTVLITLF